MQLWKKNFLVTFLLFLLILYGSLGFLDLYISSYEWEQWTKQALNEEDGVLHMMAGIKYEPLPRVQVNAEYIAGQYADAGIYLQISK